MDLVHSILPLAGLALGLAQGCQPGPLALAPPARATPSAAAGPITITLGSELTMTFVPLPGGRFVMGSPEGVGYDAEHPAHEVVVGPFAMAATEITLDQWDAVGLQGERDRKPMDKDKADMMGERPIDSLDFCAAVRLANALSERLPGAQPVYRDEGCQRGGEVGWDRTKRGVRLPTEAEWEYAARAGTTTLWWTGDDPADLEPAAWFAQRGSAGVHPVAQKRPNPWGLYDMNGNVWEWTWDLWAAYGAEPKPGETRRVVRGGGAWHVADLARSAFRYPREPLEPSPGQGLRLVLDAGLGGGTLR